MSFLGSEGNSLHVPPHTVRLSSRYIHSYST